MFDDFGDIVEGGMVYAFAGHLLDEHARKLNQAIVDAEWASHDREHIHRLEPQDLVSAEGSADWDMFFGQEQVKAQLRVHIDSAKARNAPLPHVLLASGAPGVGKTELSKLIAKEMGVRFAMMVPPFPKDVLYRTARALQDREILFLDEVHKVADGGQRSAEMLLHLLEEGRMFQGGQMVRLANITVIGATTDPDKLPETVLDRFPIKPHFRPYTQEDLTLITARFEGLHGVELDFDVTMGIAKACRGVPRIARELVIAARDLAHSLGRPPSLEELLGFKETDPDGVTQKHKRYLVTMLRFFRQNDPDGKTVYMSGEDSIRTILRETRQGMLRIERDLIQMGFLEKTPRGRKLTQEGVHRARRYAKEAAV